MSSTISAAAREQAVESAPPIGRHTPGAAADPVLDLHLDAAGVLVGLTVTKGGRSHFFWHVTGPMDRRARSGAEDPPVFLHVGRPAMDAARVAVRAADVPAAQWPAAPVRSSFLNLSGGHRHQPGPDAVAPGDQPAAFALPAVLIGLVITPYVTLRPKAVSWLLLSLRIWFLLEVSRKSHGARCCYSVLRAWSNLHGVTSLAWAWSPSSASSPSSVGRPSARRRAAGRCGCRCPAGLHGHPGRPDWGPLPVPLCGALHWGLGTFQEWSPLVPRAAHRPSALFRGWG